MPGRIRRAFVSVIDVRPREGLSVALLSLYFFLVITSYYVIKPVRNSVFIQRVGADNLPYVYILAALLVSLLITVYSRWADRITRRTLVQGTFAFLAANLVFFWWILNRGGLLASGGFYIWGKVYPLLLVSQFWLVANDFFTTPQAKRLFGLIGAGGIIGGIAGSGISGAFATLLGSERLLLVSALLLAACSLLLVVIDRVLTPTRRPPPPVRQGDGPPPGAWKLMRESAHLRTIAFILGLTIIVSTIVDWQLAKAVELFVSGEDAKTAFFGQFFVGLNVASVIVQFVLTSWVLRVFGVGIALLLLPIGLLTGSLGILIHPGLWTTAFAKGTEGALRYSLDQSTRELLFLPLPPGIKYRGKPLIDLVVYRGGTGVAGVLVLVGNGLFGLELRGMAIVAAIVVALWLAATFVMRREFKASVRRLIRSRDVEARELLVQHLDAATRSELVGALEGDDETEILYALSLLDGIDDRSIIARADRLLEHPSDPVRTRTLQVLNEAHLADLEAVDSYVPRAKRLTEDPSLPVRSEAIRFVCQFGPSPTDETLRSFLAAGEPEIRAAAVACAARYGGAEEASTANTLLVGMASQRAGPGATRERRAAAEAIGHADGREDIIDSLIDLLHDPETPVQIAAMRAAARSRHPKLVPHLLAHLCCAHVRAPARTALAAYRSAVVPSLVDHLRNRSLPLEVRHGIPSVLYEIGQQEAVDALVRALPRLRPVSVRRAALKTLGRMRRNYDQLDFPRPPLERALRIELRKGYQFATDRAVIGPGELLGALLVEHVRRSLERACRILGLLYPQADVFSAYQGLMADDPAVRAAGYELLDSTLTVVHRRLIGPLADPELSFEERGARGAAMMKRVVREDRAAVLARLGRHEDTPWVAAVARGAGGGYRRGPARRIREPFHTHPLPRARRPFTLLLSTGDEPTIMKLVERAEMLRRAEIFSFVQAEDLAKIAAIADEREYAAGEALFREGDEGAEMFLVVSGRLRATRGGADVFEAGPGEAVGTLTLIDSRPREATVVAAAEATVLAIARDDFFDLMRNHFNLAEGMFIHLARLLREQPGGGDPERT